MTVRSRSQRPQMTVSGEIPYYKITPIAVVTAENMDEVIVDGGFHSKEDVYLNVKE